MDRTSFQCGLQVGRRYRRTMIVKAHIGALGKQPDRDSRAQVTARLEEEAEGERCFVEDDVAVALDSRRLLAGWPTHAGAVSAWVGGSPVLQVVQRSGTAATGPPEGQSSSCARRRT
jgi:hypothetical protein